jgi:hypothetical protein
MCSLQESVLGRRHRSAGSVASGLADSQGTICAGLPSATVGGRANTKRGTSAGVARFVVAESRM